jgi:hypothetical protein
MECFMKFQAMSLKLMTRHSLSLWKVYCRISHKWVNKSTSILFSKFQLIMWNIFSFQLSAHYTRCFKKCFATLKTYRNLYRGHTQCFELSKCSKILRVLSRIVVRNCFDLYFRFLLHYTSSVTVHRPGIRVLRYSRTSPRQLTTLKAYREHTQRFELTKCSKTHRFLPRIVMVQCDFHW